ncbi:alkyl hydroperoxide reductase/ Thiol specific antioxidant/ Mal allergen [Isosphaera pallida ATCC 43644]|jgi:thiol-disulfide isomerase/thioredoxin|uniref:Alkyl hydroperoxide reductase/ Thiol specific antioxidant/ Mal allergen n=1 Tax=Isosphaera pallida (strain ATCC 43644 / DSM 9630 / IS1B) TaxID=575540 RepID=E8R050_ISOPI|nr:thioredoxin family protein [Isosphaera pallida]ADV61168.1 alkyl hydroperoxide reductase/ Thiol specific antioxidant/ Mal allergen [Isosphaera pallida ATCC 43644]
MRSLALSLTAVLFLVAPAFGADVKYNNQITIGQKAPGFSGIPATTPTGEDTSISLDECKEDVVVLVFLANHCPVVVAYEDRIIELADSFKGKSVKFVGVCCTTAPGQVEQDNLAAIKERVKEKGYNFVYGYDETQAIGKAYGARVTPEFFVLDKNRNVVYAGALDDSPQNPANAKKFYLKDAINAALNGETVATPTTRAVGCGIRYQN